MTTEIAFPLNHHSPIVFTSTESADWSDFFSGNVNSKYVKVSGYQGCLFTLTKGTGAVGTATATIQAATAQAGTGATNIAYKYRRMATNDTWGSWTEQTSTGVTTTAAADDQYQFWVQSDGLATLGVGGDKWLRITFTEVDSTAVSAHCTCTLVAPRTIKDIPATVIA